MAIKWWIKDVFNIKIILFDMSQDKLIENNNYNKDKLIIWTIKDIIKWLNDE